MELYYSDLLAPRKACAVAKYVRADVAFIYLDPNKREQKSQHFLAINPNGKIPALRDGELRLWEADAIMCYLSERTGADLWPQGPRQIEMLRWLSWNAHHFNRAGGTLYFEHIVRPRFGLGDPDPAVVEDARAEFRTYAAVLNEHLKGRKWLVDNRLSVADFSVANTLPYAERSAMPLAEFPEVSRWHDQLNEIEAWREPFPAAAR